MNFSRYLSSFLEVLIPIPQNGSGPTATFLANVLAFSLPQIPKCPDTQHNGCK